MEKLSKAVILILALNQYLQAQLSITTLDSIYTVNFDSTLAGINSMVFDGSGFASAPASGQIDSDGLIVTGMSDGDLYFGADGTSGDFTQGVSEGGVSTGGIYAFIVSDQNAALGFQPTETDWSPGAVILRITNSSGKIINTFDITYKVYSFNDQERSGTVEFYYSPDNTTYQRSSSLNFASVQMKDESPAWNYVLKSIKISARINYGDNLFLKWLSNDAAGSGSRDEIALDDITIEAHYEDLRLIITEVADNQTSDEEYVEIFNGGSDVVDIEGWKLIERYNRNNNDERELTINSGSQKNSGGSGYLHLTAGEYAVIVRSDYSALKSNYDLGNDMAIFEDSWPPAMTGDERYMLVDAFGDVIDKFGAWQYEDESSFRLAANNCYERVNIEGDGEIEENWTVSANNEYNYTPGTSNITPLPVELVQFYARIKNACVILCWQTASEINNYGFELERHTISNGQSEVMNHSGWEMIGFIQGHGNSHSPKNYSYTDNPDKSRDYLYRLKQIDVNGDFDYSKCVRVSFPSERQQIRLYQNYPNPFSAGAGSASAGNTKTMIKYNIPVNSRQYAEGGRHAPESGIRHQVSVSVKVYDITGREVATLVNKKQSPGEYKIEFDGSNLPSGIYFYTVETPRGSLSKKMLILK